MDGPDNHRTRALQRLRQQAQRPFDDISRTTLDRGIVACGNPWGLGPLPPATTQGPTLGQREGLPDVLLPLSHASIRHKESLTKAPGFFRREGHAIAVLGVAS